MGCELTLRGGYIAPMDPEALDQARRFEDMLLGYPQADIRTDHLLHAGMYARTVLIPAGTAITGALIKLATCLIISGDVYIGLGDRAERLTGYHVLAGAAGRKQGFLAIQDTYLTMLFPTDATTVEQAEEQFTDDVDMLLSRQPGAINTVLNTGGATCLE